MRLLPCAGCAAALITMLLPASAHAQSPTPTQNTPWNVEVSVGWALIDDETRNAEDVLGAAARALGGPATPRS